MLAALQTVAAARDAQAQERDSEEIVVTAAHRNQSVLDTTINMSALGAEQLEDAGVRDLNALVRLTPGVSYNGGGVRTGGANSIVMRGLSMDGTSQSGAAPIAATVPMVATYIGETPAFVNVQLADLQRVEVLRGPQGTLYGSASIGGTVRYLFNVPELESFSGSLSAEVGHTEHAGGVNHTVDGVINVPIGTQAAFRVAAGVTDLYGFIDQPHLFAIDANGLPILQDPSDPLTSIPLSTSAKDTDGSRVEYVRPSFLWSDGPWRTLVTFQYQRETADGVSVDSYPGSADPSSYTPDLTPGFLNPDFDASFPTTFGEYESGHFLREPYEREVDVGSLEVSYDFGFATLTSVSSAYWNRARSTGDSSGFYQRSLGFLYFGMPSLSTPAHADARERAFIQEARLVSSSDGPLRWIAGAFYLDQYARLTDADLIPGWSRFATALFGTPIDEEVGFTYDRVTSFNEIAVYGEVSYDILPQWQVTAGARAFDQQADISARITLPICGAFCASDGVDPEGSSGASDSQSERDVLFKLNTSYEFTADLMGYLTYSEGQRRGGANGVPTAGLQAQDPDYTFFEPDSVRSYEIGLKAEFARQWALSAAIYQIDWDEPQVNVSTPIGFPAAVNGSTARSRGLDIEAQWRPFSGLIVRGAYGYIDAELTGDVIVAGGVVASEGVSLPGSPQHQGAISIDYEHVLYGSLWGGVHLDASYRGETNTSVQPRFNSELESFWMANASAYVAGDAWRLTGFVNNIFNERGVQSRESLETYDIRYVNNRIARPRTIGLRATYEFGD